ncbi:MAG: hypothetical protein M3268_08925 [Acidobacteriota bacterium]|nr:hypothetical protein [Acidobacteriota bacterium]
MISRVLRFVRLPLVLLLIWAALRLFVGLRGVPYAPRGNAMFSVVGLTIISCLYFGAMSRRVGGFNWVGTILVGLFIGLWAQILVILATILSYVSGRETYFTHWDALNLPEGAHATLAQAMTIRAGGLVANIIISVIAALLGRAIFSALAPKCND